MRTGESGEEVLQAHPDAGGRRLGERLACARRRDLKRKPAASRGGAAGSSSGCAPSTSRWSTPCWAATASPQVAALAADAAGAPVAIVVPRLGAAVAAPARRARRTSTTLRRYVADRVKDRPAQVPPSGRRRGADHVRRRRRRRGRCCSTGPTPAAARGGRVPAPRGGRLAHRGRGRGGQGGGRAEPARLVPRGPALAPGPRAARGRAPRRAPRLRPVARRRRAVRRADDRPPAPRGGDDRRRPPRRAGPAHGRARLRAAARRRRRRRARAHARARARGWPSACAATARSACRASTPTRPSSARAIQEAELVLDVLRQSDAPIAAGHRHRHLPAAVPRARLAPRGGALVLRGHGRADRPLRRPVPHRPRRARSRPTSSRTAT